MVYNTKHILARYLAQMILVDEDLRSFLPRTDDKYLELAAHVQRYANRLKEDTNYGDHAEYAQFMADCPRYMALFLCREPLRVRRQRGYASRNEVARPSAIGLGGRAQLLVPAILHPPTSKFHAAALAQKISGMSLDKWTALGNFLRYRPAVESLALEASMGLALRLPGNKAGTLMRLIAGTTSPALNSHGLERTVTYDITWELATVLKKVWGRVEEGDMVSGAALTPDGLKNKSIKEMLVINGCAETAQVTTCEEYVKEHWKSALPLLDALDMSAWGAKPLDHRTEDGATIHLSGSQNDQHGPQITVKATFNHHADVAAALAWLAASIRYADTEALLESSASIVYQHAEPALRLRIQCHDLQEAESSDICWHRLFAAEASLYASTDPAIPLRKRPKVVALDYPIHERAQGRGLEVPYGLLTALVGPPVEQEFIRECSRGYVLGGAALRVLPLQALGGERDGGGAGGAMQWWLQQAQGGEGRGLGEWLAPFARIRPEAECLKLTKERMGEVSAWRAFVMMY